MFDKPSQSRRKFLALLGGLSASAALPSTSFANIHKPLIEVDQSLSLINLHTGEKLSSTFMSEGALQQDSLAALNHLLRDHRNDEVFAMDPALFALLHKLQMQFHMKEPMQVISAYRSPATNEMLRKSNKRVAKKSFHMQGKAIDIRLPGVELRDLHKAALALRGGGVGLYTRSNFLHLDVGHVRSWGA